MASLMTRTRQVSDPMATPLLCPGSQSSRVQERAAGQLCPMPRGSEPPICGGFRPTVRVSDRCHRRLQPKLWGGGVPLCGGPVRAVPSPLRRPR